MKLNKWILVLTLLTLAGFLLGGCATASGAEDTPKVYRVGIIVLNAFTTMEDGFKTKMTELGYVEGKNIVYDIRRHDTDLDAEQKDIDKFVADKVDLIFVLGTPPAFMAKKTAAGTGIPVLFASAVVEGNNLIETVRNPGGNITGVRFPGADLTLKRLEFLLAIVPQAKRIWVAYDPDNQSAAPAIKALRPAASSAGITLVEVPIKSVAEIEADLQAHAKAGKPDFDAILIMPEGLTQSAPGWAVISKFAAEHKIPIGGSAAFEADQGAIFSYIPDNIETGALAAPLADKIFKGTPAGTISVVSPEAHLRLNYKLTQELGLTVSEGLLSQAVEIIR